MPNYEYRCLDCKRKFEIFLSYREYGQKPVTCPHCKSSAVERRIGRVRIGRSDASRLENLADPSKLQGLDDDPRALGQMMRQMSSEVGDDMAPEFNEVVSRLEAGQTPDQIERDLPDLAGGDADGMGGMGDMGGFGGGMDDF